MKRKNRDIKQVIKNVREELKPSKFDPFGSYTGKSVDKEKPVQDQDDL